MVFYKGLVCFSGVIAVINSFQPNCDFSNQFEKFCLPVQYCNDLGCALSKCGRFAFDTKIVRIKGSRIIPTCAFSNASNLKQIHGVDRQIQVLASGSFVNLPKLENIDLSFNYIRELHHEIFKNVTVSSLDLSWNKIIYISEGALSGVNGLKHLNLSRNELTTLPFKHFPLSIVDLNLSHNNLERLAVNAATRPDLLDVDLSYNALEHIALSFNNIVNKLDLSYNRLKDVDFFDVFACVELRIPGNLFSEIPDFLTYSRIKNVDLYPNPWKCEDLEELWELLQNNLVNIVTNHPSDKAEQNSPICTASSNNLTQASARIINTNLICEDDTQCEDNMVCRARNCWDPCKTNICGETKVCTVTSHRVECKCREKLKEDPKEIYSPCYDVECTLDDHCSGGYCRYDKTCVRVPVGIASSQSSGSQYSSGQYSGYSPQFPISSFGPSSPSGGYFSGGSSSAYSSGGLSGGFGYRAPAQNFFRPGYPSSSPDRYFGLSYSAPIPFYSPEYAENSFGQRYPSQSYQDNPLREYYNRRYPTDQGYYSQGYRDNPTQGYYNPGYSGGQGYSSQGYRNNPPREYYNPGYQGSQGYSSGAYAASVATYPGAPSYSKERPSPQMKPWWFDDIQKEVPNDGRVITCILNEDCPEGICHSNKTCVKNPSVSIPIGRPTPISYPGPLAPSAANGPPAPTAAPTPVVLPASIASPAPIATPAPVARPAPIARPIPEYSNPRIGISVQGYSSPTPVQGYSSPTNSDRQDQGILGQSSGKGYFSGGGGIFSPSISAGSGQISSNSSEIAPGRVSSFTPVGNNSAQVPQEVPWWFDEIPKMIPSTKKQS